MKRYTTLALIAFFISYLSYSQGGIVRGTITDADFQDPVPFANILVKETGTGTTSDFDGNFEIFFDEGIYTLQFSYLGYKTIEISEVEINSLNPKEVNVIMEVLAEGLDEVVVAVSARKNTESAVLSFQKKSASLVDGLSSQRIKSTGASDIASAVKSVPGVSVQGGKYVYVRGLGDRYTKSILNGIDIPGLDPDRNTVQMDLFPTNILDNVIVIKSSTAEMPADFTGGIVDVVTKEFPTSKQLSISIGTAYNPDMHYKNDYLGYSGGSTDFLGFDDGTRSLPVNPNRNYTFLEVFNQPIQTEITNKYSSNLSALRQSSLGDYSFSISGGNQKNVGKDGENKIGYFGSVSYKNETEYYENAQNNNYFKDPNSSIFELDPSNTQNGDLGINNVILSGMGGVSYKTNNSKLKLNLLHIQNGESSAGSFFQSRFDTDFIDLKKDNLEYTERSISNLLFSGTHSLDNGGWKIEWKLSPTRSSIQDKDARTTSFQLTDDGGYRVPTNTRPTRIWRDLNEINVVSKIDITNKLSLFGNDALFKFGLFGSYKQRDYDIYSTQITVNSGVTGNADELLFPENIWSLTNTNGNHIDLTYNLIQQGKSFDASQNNYAGYSSVEFKISPSFRSIIGLRAENYFTTYTGQDSSGFQNLVDEKVIDKFDVFPSANFIFAITENSNYRLSYSKTTARPSFKEASIAEIFDPLSNITFIGNLNLKPTYIDNIDLRFENFGEGNELFAISAFYKVFKDPIELSYYEQARETFQPRNLGEAKVYGLEIEFRKNLNNFFNANINASLIESKQTYGQVETNLRTLALRDGETLTGSRQLQGQSPYLINASLDFNNQNGTRAGLYFNMQGKTLEVVGAGYNPDIYTHPFESLNFTFSKSFGQESKKSINLKVENILGSKRESYAESFRSIDQIYTFRDPGLKFSLGYSINL
jgi:TonB-dependent receptor